MQFKLQFWTRLGMTERFWARYMVTVITKILDTACCLKPQNLILFQWFDLPVSTGGMGKQQNILWQAHYRQLVSPLTCCFKWHHHSRFSSFHISPEDRGRSNLWKIVGVFSPSQLTTTKISGMTRVNTAPLILRCGTKQASCIQYIAIWKKFDIQATVHHDKFL